MLEFTNAVSFQTWFSTSCNQSHALSTQACTKGTNKLTMLQVDLLVATRKMEIWCLLQRMSWS